MGFIIFVLVIFLVIRMIRSNIKSDKTFQKTKTYESQPKSTDAFYFFIDEDFYDEDYYDDYFYESDDVPFQQSTSFSHQTSFFDRIMDSSTPESGFIKGLEDEGYDVEDW